MIAFRAVPIIKGFSDRGGFLKNSFKFFYLLITTGLVLTKNSDLPCSLVTTIPLMVLLNEQINIGEQIKYFSMFLKSLL